MQKLLREILTSKVYEAAVETPLEFAPVLSEALNNRILIKREDLQPGFSFKIRGAYNRMAHLSREERQKGVIAASAGNHAQGVSLAAQKLGIRALIVMPKTTPRIKIDAVQRMGGEVLLHGNNFSEAQDHCNRMIDETGMVFISAFDDELIIAGHGTVAYELLRQTTGRMDAVFVPIGGGGLISGIASYLKALCPGIKVIGVEPTDSNAMFLSLQAGRRVSLDFVGIFADGVAIREVGSLPFDICRRLVDEIILVDTDELCSAIKSIYQNTRSIAEPAGALGVAGLKKYVRERKITGQTLVAVNSGANINFESLRYVAERTLVGEKQEALFAVTIPERPGSLKSFCAEIGEERNITEFNYRLTSREEAHIFVGLSVRDEGERVAFSQILTEKGFPNTDLTDNELAKTHIRYMVGGKSAEVKREVLYRFLFPERPGALPRFLASMGENWNISLFHYRMQGGDYGQVLIGLEIPQGEEDAFHTFLRDLGYRYVEESTNAAYRLFL